MPSITVSLTMEQIGYIDRTTDDSQSRSARIRELVKLGIGVEDLGNGVNVAHSGGEVEES